MERPFKKVVIVGAGPSGLLMAIFLSRHGIEVQVLEANDHLDMQPRAAAYGPPAMPDLRRAGILDEIRKQGITIGPIFWRKSSDLSLLSGFDGDVLEDVDGVDQRMTCLTLYELDKLMLDIFVSKYNGKIYWKHKVTAAGSDADKGWVEVETPEGKQRIEADYIIGADGANSQVRRSLFGEEFPGFTWDEQIVATNTYYDFPKHGYHDVTFHIHPQDFFMSCKLTKDGLYRVTYGEKAGLTLDELKARQAERFENILPGRPKPGDYKTINFAPYKMHQRCAPKFRVGRCLLVADAAHLCNPWGGLGITGGFVDVGGLYDCLLGIYEGKADESILDIYSEKRIEKWKTVIDPISQDNFRRVKDADPDTIMERDEWLQMCEKTRGDTEATKDLLMGLFSVRYDFTQHYKK